VALAAAAAAPAVLVEIIQEQQEAPAGLGSHIQSVAQAFIMQAEAEEAAVSPEGQAVRVAAVRVEAVRRMVLEVLLIPAVVEEEQAQHLAAGRQMAAPAVQVS